MFIWKKTYELLRKELKCLYRQLEGSLDASTKVYKDLQQSEEAFASLCKDYTILQSKHAHLREVLENIRPYGGLLHRHRRSIDAALKS